LLTRELLALWIRSDREERQNWLDPLLSPGYDEFISLFIYRPDVPVETGDFSVRRLYNRDCAVIERDFDFSGKSEPKEIPPPPTGAGDVRSVFSPALFVLLRGNVVRKTFLNPLRVKFA
jgi:hypothetical protein